MEPVFGICLHTFTTHPNESKSKALNFYGVFFEDQLIVTRDNKGDYYHIPIAELQKHNPNDNYLVPKDSYPLPIPTQAPNIQVCEQISAAHKAWKHYFKLHKTKKKRKKHW